MFLPMLHPNLQPSLHYPLLFVLIGVLLLLLGRRLFWLFVAAAGFVVGLELGPLILPHQGELFTLLVALGLGILGAMLAIFVQKLAISVAGFIVGGYIAASFVPPLLLHAGFHLGSSGITHPATWVCFLVGGILGAWMMMTFFNLALVILSSLQGAHMIVHGLPTPRGYASIIVVILAVIGIAIQFGTYRRSSTSKEE
jgi:hypothetical protein